MAIDDVIVDLVRDELERITDSDGLASRGALQAGVGIGANDLQRALDVLRERGEASEVEPDGFRLVRPGEPEQPAPAPRAPDPVEETPGVAGARAPMAAQARADGVKTITMTAAVARAIGKDGLGNLVSAGIEEAAEAGVLFVFEVAP